MKNQANQKVLKSLAAVRGVERKRHFENGGSLHSWRGGLHTTTKDQKRNASRKACRGKKWN